MGRAKTTIQVGEHSIELSSQDKLMFPDDGITKGEMVEYYREVAALMVPHLADRPLTVHRFPGGIAQKGFLQKESGEHYPAWIERADLPKEDGETHYPLGNSAAALVWFANQNCVAFHPVAVRRPRLDRPDLLFFDLDPSDEDFEKVRAGARMLREILGFLELVPYVKTTGSRGLHIVAPILPEYTTDEVREFARGVAELLVRRDPGRFTVDISKKKREDRVFVDWLRNGHAQTAAAPYSLRALPGAPVATPIAWAELEDPRLNARTYGLRSLLERLWRVGDPWLRIRQDERSLAPAMRLLPGM
jgi:bifunctional non-homologous end joining protein LigD